MKLTKTEKKVLNTLFTGVKGTTRNQMLLALYASKPEDDGSADSQAIIKTVNALITKIYNANQFEMEKIFAKIPFEL